MTIVKKSMSHSGRKDHSARFLAQYILKPGTVGAVTPSSAELADQMMEGLEFSEARAIIEYGPGTGVFSEAVLARRSAGCKFFAIELNPEFVTILKNQIPELTIHHDSVGNVRALCDREGIKQVDCIVSGLPWAAFSDALQKELLDAMMTVLRPGGQFVTFAYLAGLFLPAGLHFRKRLHEYFSEVRTSRTVWNNVPPAFVYRCRR